MAVRSSRAVQRAPLRRVWKRRRTDRRDTGEAFEKPRRGRPEAAPASNVGTALTARREARARCAPSVAACASRTCRPTPSARRPCRAGLYVILCPGSFHGPIERLPASGEHATGAGTSSSRDIGRHPRTVRWRHAHVGAGVRQNTPTETELVKPLGHIEKAGRPDRECSGAWSGQGECVEPVDEMTPMPAHGNPANQWKWPKARSADFF